MNRRTGTAWRGRLPALPRFRQSLIFNLQSAMLCLLAATGMLAGTAQGAAIYVSTNATPAAPYNTWATAFTKLQDALDYAGAKTNATICLAGGIFTGPALGSSHPDNTVFRWQNATNVALRGGYRADTALDDPAPGSNNPALYPTVLRRSTADNVRVLTMAGVSNAVIEQVTIRDGYAISPDAAPYLSGGGVFIDKCQDVAIKDSVITANSGSRSSGDAFDYSQWASGGGIAIDGNSRVTVTNSTIDGNTLSPGSRYSRGAGIFVASGSSLTLTRSSVQNNLLNYPDSDQVNKRGAGFYSSGALDIHESVIKGNKSSGETTVVLYGAAGYNEGTLRMRSSLVLGNSGAAGSSDGIHLAGGVATLVNCTIVNNGAIGLRYGGGAVSVTNCIFRGHSAADLADFPANAAGHLLNVGYSAFALPATMAGVRGCITNDPLFVNAASNDYRLRETPFSPCIDKGMNEPWMKAATDLDGEPRVQSGAVDMGACEYRHAPPFVQNGGVSNVTAKTATVYGHVLSVGGEVEAAVLLFYGLSDGGTNRSGWDNEYRFPSPRKVGVCHAAISPNRFDALWHYRFCATNIYGAGWAEDGKCFLTGAVGVKATKRESTEERPAAFVIFRPATATNGPLEVHYTLGGTGVNEKDYDRLDGSALVPAGATEVQLPVIPSFNLGETRPKTVQLSIAPGGYLIGASSNVTILTQAE